MKTSLVKYFLCYHNREVIAALPFSGFVHFSMYCCLQWPSAEQFIVSQYELHPPSYSVVLASQLTQCRLQWVIYPAWYISLVSQSAYEANSQSIGSPILPIQIQVSSAQR